MYHEKNVLSSLQELTVVPDGSIEMVSTNVIDTGYEKVGDGGPVDLEVYVAGDFVVNRNLTIHVQDCATETAGSFTTFLKTKAFPKASLVKSVIPLLKMALPNGMKRYIRLVFTQAETGPAPAWVKNTAYVLGNYISNDGKSYVCLKAGTSEDADAAGPTGFAPVVDGTAYWGYVTPEKLVIYSAWVKNTAYTAGGFVTNDGKLYVCKTSGTSANTDNAGPKTLLADITDGTAHWTYITAGKITAYLRDRQR